ncbi:proline--tRNA ligase [Promethearchaeum syntrophicum]|uniref:Proline--tRNA ligase n=1 Tax=Promethearchaeum syntrophicum TaxID=2594042 RepID=A0A5B9D8Z6_9ARCH|nr:proline--tRNA ligase [Candidatus Prometheoarchaeum syntrophicum]QEE15491.1 Proline--tRNA ligase [Candidatus Prometheoarchaeum syntrophicum]
MQAKKNKKTQSSRKPAKKTSKKVSKKTSKSKIQNTLPDIDENFSEWFNEIIFQAEILDYRYNLKGCGVWLGYGFKIRRKYLEIMRDLLDNTPIPHEEMLFPLLIPKDQFMKEKETVKGFETEVYWVTHGGLTPLDVKLALRPTSETVMYPMVAKWIRSHQDLPLKTYQISNMFRFEGKNTRPLIRVRELTTFKEAHTYHETKEDCTDQIREAVSIYKKIFDTLGVPYLITQRPKWDTFPGADYTIAFDCIFLQSRKALQIGTIHNLGQTFSKTFDIKFETADGNQEYVYQTCYGISERGVASLIAVHGDSNGLKLPPVVAPIEIVIVPILFKNKEDEVMKVCNEFYDKLKKEGFKVRLDNRKISSGRKYFHWELRGIPIRVEIGPKDIAKNQIAVVRRDIKGKEFVPIDDSINYLHNLLKDIQQSLQKTAKKRHDELIFRTNDLEEAIDFIDKNKGIAEIPFCGEEDCAESIEKRLDGLKFLGIPERYLPILNKRVKKEKEIYCSHCMKPVTKYWRMGKTY